MPSNYTPNYQLNQWEAGDQVRRVDFNADNAKIDAAVKAVNQRVDSLSTSKAAQTALNALSQTVAGKGNCQIATGSYTGTGTFGVNSPNTLTLPFQPLLVVIAANDNGSPAVLVPGTEEHLQVTGMVSRWNLTWAGNRVSWYISQLNWASGSSESPSAYYQMNAENMLYRYVVFGKKS